MDIKAEDDIFVTIDDMRRVGYCGKGARVWASQYGLEWNKFVHEGGIMGSVLLATGDGLAEKIIAEVRAKRGA